MSLIFESLDGSLLCFTKRAKSSFVKLKTGIFSFTEIMVASFLNFDSQYIVNGSDAFLLFLYNALEIHSSLNKEALSKSGAFFSFSGIFERHSI